MFGVEDIRTLCVNREAFVCSWALDYDIRYVRKVLQPCPVILRHKMSTKVTETGTHWTFKIFLLILLSPAGSFALSGNLSFVERFLGLNAVLCVSRA